jgi:hypothetical protein
MTQIIDLLPGQRFGRLVVVSRYQCSGEARYNVRCDCGTEKTVSSVCLRRGTSRSCGCLKKDLAVVHGHASRHAASTEYLAWCGMRARCENPNSISWADYGGRGIKVCERWEKFENFLLDMGKKPNPRLTLERRDNSLGYSPENCYWATRAQQSSNTRRTRLNPEAVKVIRFIDCLVRGRKTLLAKLHGIDLRSITKIQRGESWA